MLKAPKTCYLVEAVHDNRFITGSVMVSLHSDKLLHDLKSLFPQKNYLKHFMNLHKMKRKHSFCNGLASVFVVSGEKYECFSCLR